MFELAHVCVIKSSESVLSILFQRGPACQLSRWMFMHALSLIDLTSHPIFPHAESTSSTTAKKPKYGPPEQLEWVEPSVCKWDRVYQTAVPVCLLQQACMDHSNKLSLIETDITWMAHYTDIWGIIQVGMWNSFVISFLSSHHCW